MTYKRYLAAYQGHTRVGRTPYPAALGEPTMAAQLDLLIRCFPGRELVNPLQRSSIKGEVIGIWAEAEDGGRLGSAFYEWLLVNADR